MHCYYISLISYDHVIPHDYLLFFVFIFISFIASVFYEYMFVYCYFFFVSVSASLILGLVEEHGELYLIGVARWIFHHSDRKLLTAKGKRLYNKFGSNLS